MKENISRFKGIMIIAIVCIILYFTIYPLYIRWIAGNYAKKFSDVLNSHDMEKMQAFTSKGSYGRLEEWYDYKELIMITCLRKEYTVDFFLPISDYHDGKDTKPFIEGEMILKRKWMFFFDIEKVTFYVGYTDDDGDTEFLEDFLGI